MLGIGICGADGKMGQTLLRLLKNAPDMRAQKAIVEPGSPMLQRDIAPLVGFDKPLICTDQIDALDCDILIDFSQPSATQACLETCVIRKKGLVIGTTGHSKEQIRRIQEGSSQVPVFLAANMSQGIHVCAGLARTAAKQLGEDYDIEISEAHHKHKQDAPSGTALAFGDILASLFGKKLGEIAVYDRRNTGKRKRGTIGFQVMRGGDIVGEHKVCFIGEGETIEISHRATSRVLFARGALRAAAWLGQNFQPGLYSMDDML